MDGDWRDIPGYAGGYQVTRDGRVRSVAGGELKPFHKDRKQSGRYVNLYLDGDMRRVSVSTLVALAYSNY